MNAKDENLTCSFFKIFVSFCNYSIALNRLYEIMMLYQCVTLGAAYNLPRHVSFETMYIAAEVKPLWWDDCLGYPAQHSEWNGHLRPNARRANIDI